MLNFLWNVTKCTPFIKFCCSVAAHCVYDEETQKAIEPSYVKVGAGKYKRSWTANDVYEQKRDVIYICLPLWWVSLQFWIHFVLFSDWTWKVREVVTHNFYKGASTSYTADIAVLDLVSNIILNNFVLPVCVDWFAESTYPTGTLSTVR